MKSELTAIAKEISANDKQALIKFAAEKGFTLTEDDFKQEESELSEDELQAVAGGGCSWMGCGTDMALYCAAILGALLSW